MAKIIPAKFVEVHTLNVPENFLKEALSLRLKKKNLLLPESAASKPSWFNIVMRDLDLLTIKLNPTKNIELRFPSDQELHSLAELVFLPENFKHVFKYTGFSKELNDPDGYYEKRLKSAPSRAKDHESAYLAIFYKGKIAGRVIASIIDPACGKMELSYFLFKEFLGIGIMLSSIKTVEEFLFNELDANRIELWIDPANKHSVNLALKLKYQLEGTLRQSYHNEFLDENRDDMVFAKLKSDIINL